MASDAHRVADLAHRGAAGLVHHQQAGSVAAVEGHERRAASTGPHHAAPRASAASAMASSSRPQRRCRAGSPVHAGCAPHRSQPGCARARRGHRAGAGVDRKRDGPNRSRQGPGLSVRGGPTMSRSPSAPKMRVGLAKRGRKQHIARRRGARHRALRRNSLIIKICVWQRRLGLKVSGQVEAPRRVLVNISRKTKGALPMGNKLYVGNLAYGVRDDGLCGLRPVRHGDLGQGDDGPRHRPLQGLRLRRDGQRRQRRRRPSTA